MQCRVPNPFHAAAALALAALVAAPAVLAAQSTPAKGTVDRYTATAAKLKGVAGETITIDVLRWSTDEERDKVIAALAKGDKDTDDTLAGMPNLGYIWRSGSSFGSFVRYAARFKAADGEHIVLATDSDLAGWQGTEAAAPYAVIEIVTPASGAAAGKTSLGGKVVADAASKSIRIDNYAAGAVQLTGVKHTKGA